LYIRIIKGPIELFSKHSVGKQYFDILVGLCPFIIFIVVILSLKFISVGIFVLAPMAIWSAMKIKFFHTAINQNKDAIAKIAQLWIDNEDLYKLLYQGRKQNKSNHDTLFWDNFNSDIPLNKRIETIHDFVNGNNYNHADFTDALVELLLNTKAILEEKRTKDTRNQINNIGKMVDDAIL
jgi:hypothetical protein